MVPPKTPGGPEDHSPPRDTKEFVEMITVGGGPTSPPPRAEEFEQPSDIFDALLDLKSHLLSVGPDQFSDFSWISLKDDARKIRDLLPNNLDPPNDPLALASRDRYQKVSCFLHQFVEGMYGLQKRYSDLDHSHKVNLDCPAGEDTMSLLNDLIGQFSPRPISRIIGDPTEVAVDASEGSVLFDKDKGVLVTGNSSVSLETGERYVLNILVSKGAAKLSEMYPAHARPDRVLKSLLKKYPSLEGHITLPGGPGKGGYSTTIKLKETENG